MKFLAPVMALSACGIAAAAGTSVMNTSSGAENVLATMTFRVI
ncbi:MAG: hypothetical protein P4L33_08315 [Capsulimonadaceae bacterium]|nr:hypothetical protein [Capsulimonadaceae bacterium]